MAPGRNDNTLVHAVSDDSDCYSWETCLAASEKKLLVVDCHQDWCGPCETLQPTFHRVSLETTDCEERCLFLTANLEKLADQVQALSPKDATVNLSPNGCMPFTVLIKDGTAVVTIHGCDTPAILREIKKNMPPLRSENKGEPE